MTAAYGSRLRAPSILLSTGRTHRTQRTQQTQRTQRLSRSGWAWAVQVEVSHKTAAREEAVALGTADAAVTANAAETTDAAAMTNAAETTNAAVMENAAVTNDAAVTRDAATAGDRTVEASERLRSLASLRQAGDQSDRRRPTAEECGSACVLSIMPAAALNGRSQRIQMLARTHVPQRTGRLQGGGRRIPVDLKYGGRVEPLDARSQHLGDRHVGCASTAPHLRHGRSA